MNLATLQEGCFPQLADAQIRGTGVVFRPDFAELRRSPLSFAGGWPRCYQDAWAATTFYCFPCLLLANLIGWIRPELSIQVNVQKL